MAVSYTDAILEPALTTSTTIYTAPAVKSAHIDKAKVFNYSSANVTLTGNIVQSEESASETNKYIDVIVPAGQSVILYEVMGDLLNTGDAVVLTASAGSALNVKFKIREITD